MLKIKSYHDLPNATTEMNNINQFCLTANGKCHRMCLNTNMDIDKWLAILIKNALHLNILRRGLLVVTNA